MIRKNKTNAKSTTFEVYIGLDVHKSSISAAYALGDGSEPVFHGKWGGSNLALERGLARLMDKLGVSKADLRIAYEAGPTGFVAARRLQKLGYEVIVVAPSKIERASGERVKTDRKDALKLARLHRTGSLSGIHIPDATDESIRDVCRARTDASEDRRKAKQRLSAFLLRNPAAAGLRRQERLERSPHALFARTCPALADPQDGARRISPGAGFRHRTRRAARSPHGRTPRGLGARSLRSRHHGDARLPDCRGHDDHQ